jgi:hypothetical protein
MSERINGVNLKKVKTISLATILNGHNHVDLIDMDVQGSEFDVLNAAARENDGKVSRIQIGTHGKEIEQNLRSTLNKLGWKCLFDFPAASKTDTP